MFINDHNNNNNIIAAKRYKSPYSITKRILIECSSTNINFLSAIVYAFFYNTQLHLITLDCAFCTAHQQSKSMIASLNHIFKKSFPIIANMRQELEVLLSSIDNIE